MDKGRERLLEIVEVKWMVKNYSAGVIVIGIRASTAP